MASVLFKFLRILCLARRYVGRASSRWALFIALLGRKLNEWWRWRPGKLQNTKPAESSFPVNGDLCSSASPGGPIVLREYIVAASNVPASASQRSLHERAERQPETSSRPIPATVPLSTDQSYGLSPYRDLDYLSPGNFAGHSSSNVSSASSRSRASDRLSIITASHEVLHAPVRQPSEIPRSTHRQFGRSPDPSRSRGRLSRSPSPMPPPNATQQSHHLVQTGVRTHAHKDGRISPMVGRSGVPDLPSSSFNTQEPQSLSSARGRKRTTTVVWNVENPSSESLPDAATDLPQLTEEPMAMGSPAHSSVNPSAEHIETAPQLAIITSSFAFPELRYSLPANRSLDQITSEDVPRYMKNITIPREEKAYIVNPLTTTFPYLLRSNYSDQESHEQDCISWKPATHPDGALYFYDIKRKLFTDTDMHDPALKEEMEEFYHTLQGIVADNRLTLPSNDYDLVLDIMLINEGEVQWSYYYACHEIRCLFWLEPYDASYMISELAGVDSPAHVKHRMEDLYWYHWSLFPVVFGGRYLPPRVYDELIGMLAHGCVDMLTSTTSTLPYDDDKMQKMISLVEKAKDAKGGEAYHTVSASRLLSFFAHWRFVHFHGQRHARIDRDQAVYDKPKRERSILISLLSPLLFLAPEVHLREMEKLWKDDIIIETVWKTFMTKLLNEWNDLILWSTVMLTVSVSFLAVPGVTLYYLNINGDEHQALIFKSSSQIAATLSVEASVGSIIIGLLLARHNRTKQEASPSEAHIYLQENCRKHFGLEPMAIIFSLPWALLMWSMVTFSLALLLFYFVFSNHWTRIMVALTSVPVVALTLECIRTTWESPSTDGKVWRDGFQPSIIRTLRSDRVKRVRSFVLGVVGLFRVRQRFTTHVTDDADNAQPSTGPQDGDGGGV